MTAQRLLAIALFISFGLNILLGAAFFRPHMGSGHGPRHHLMAEQLAGLSDETRPKVEAIWKAHHAEMRGTFRTMHQARRALKEALTADIYSAEDVAAAMAQMDTALAAPRQHLAEAIQESAMVMSDEERKAFFDKGLRALRPPHHGPRGPRGPEGPPKE